MGSLIRIEVALATGGILIPVPDVAGAISFYMTISTDMYPSIPVRSVVIGSRSDMSLNGSGTTEISTWLDPSASGLRGSLRRSGT